MSLEHHDVVLTARGMGHLAQNQGHFYCYVIYSKVRGFCIRGAIIKILILKCPSNTKAIFIQRFLPTDAPKPTKKLNGMRKSFLTG